MALPSDVQIFDGVADPKDVIDWLVKMTGAMLESGESVESYTLVPSAEFAALGGTVMTGGGRDPALISTATQLYFWTQFSSGFQSDPAFSGEGVVLGFELTVVTNNIPSRTKQRTFAIKVRQR